MAKQRRRQHRQAQLMLSGLLQMAERETEVMAEGV